MLANLKLNLWFTYTITLVRECKNTITNQNRISKVRKHDSKIRNMTLNPKAQQHNSQSCFWFCFLNLLLQFLVF